VKPTMSLSKTFHDVVDFLIIDGLLVMGAGRLVKGASNEARQLQTGSTGFYIFAMVIGILVLLGYVVFRLKEVVFTL
jgi:NADH-quinone oxidoreductase subunit L